jgi:pectin methylesterase-like acyl-CoA thioesterase
MWQVCKKGGILCVLAACVSLAAEAATLKVPGEYATIQAAIDAAAAGDTRVQVIATSI